MTIPRAFWVAAVLLAAFFGSGAFGQDYPTKSVTMVVPFPAGGRTDVIARIVGQSLQAELKRAVAIVNRPGASSVLGANDVSEAAPDGYTIGFFSTSIITAQYTVPTPLSLVKFDLVAIVNADPAALAVNGDAPWTTLHAFVDYARSKSGALRVGTIPGASAQIFSAGFQNAAGLNFTSVPFKGDADGAIALAGGHIDVHLAVPVAYKALAASKKIKVLAIAADQRSPIYGDLPTFKENGVDFSIAAFHGVYVPKGTPASVKARLADALRLALSSAALKQRMDDVGADVMFLQGAEAQAYLDRQDETYRAIIDRLGLRVPKAP